MLEDKTGKKIPNVTFKTRTDTAWVDVTTDQIFKGKKVAVFSLPGAFTPTCSSTHLPRYNDLAVTFKEHGIDEVVCISVNDAFVMKSWGEDQEAENITLIPDGNGEFSEGMGMLVDKSAIGFGKRSWRYSMVVNDGVIEKMFIEEEKPGDPFEVSDADTMLEYLAPGLKPVAGVTIFTRMGCPHCAAAKELLNSRKLSYTEVPSIRTKALQALGGAGTYPLVFVGGELVGGNVELEAFLNK
jgi:glutathione-dependent peroxiredoxin